MTTTTKTCTGHCRAQHSEMATYNSLTYEAEKAAITSYEDGWDRWDGPIWPWRHTNLPSSLETSWTGCCTGELETQEPVKVDAKTMNVGVKGLVEKIMQKAKQLPEIEVREIALTPEHEIQNNWLWGSTGAPARL